MAKNKLSEELVCNEKKHFGFHVGNTLASSLSGFIAGFIVATIGWAAIIYVLRPFCER